MVTLIDKQDRDALGIDTYPRAILWSALLLLKNNKTFGDPESNPFFNSIRIAINPRTSILAIEALIPYSRIDFVDNNGDLLKALLTYNSGDPSINVEPVNPSEFIYLPLPNDDQRVNTLEKYFYWVTSTYKVGLRRYTDLSDNINIIFLDEREIQGNPVVEISIRLPFSYERYICYNNLLEATFELYEIDPCADGLLAIPGGFVLVFEDGVVINLGIP